MSDCLIADKVRKDRGYGYVYIKTSDGRKRIHDGKAAVVTVEHVVGSTIISSVIPNV